jgi:predicted hydrocarbon binding protein/KaiC/GvpD/RAD55 family RecA-like ATPase
MSAPELMEIPIGKSVLFIGPPGSGKSTFCQEVVLHNLAVNKPVIFMTTEYGSCEAEAFLKEKGLTSSFSGLLNYIDGYNQTVGLPVLDRPDTINVSSENLTSLGIALAKHQRNIGRKGILLVLDSLTSSYLLCGSEVVRFLRLTLSRFAGDGNAVLACFDEGSGKQEDLVGMMSISDGIIKVGIKKNLKTFEIIKHPILKPKKIQIPYNKPQLNATSTYDLEYFKQNVRLYWDLNKKPLRKQTGDFIDITWRNLILWSGMLWDPKRFPKIMYDWIKYSYNMKNFGIDLFSFLPLKERIAAKLFMPKSFSKINDMKKMSKQFFKNFESYFRIGKMEYLENKSKTDEHYYKISENYECWGLGNVGSSLAIVRPAMLSASLTGFESEDRDWNIIETKCIGLGDPFCEFRMISGKIDEVHASIRKEREAIEHVNKHIMDRLLGFLLNKRSLIERPTLGRFVHIHDLQRVTSSAISIKKLQLIFRMGGAKAGKIIGEKLIDSGLTKKEAVNQVIKLIEYCKVGKMSINETVKIFENCEKFGSKTKGPSCHFTTGFLNGFFSIVENQHMIESKCLAAGDPYCEWEFV